MTPSPTSSDRSRARLVPGILGAALVSVGLAVLATAYLGLIVGAGVLVLAVGGFFLLADRQIR